MAKSIQLTQGMEAIVDDDVYEKLSKVKWFYNGSYASRQRYRHGSQRVLFMHNEILKTPEGKCCDHINRNKLDNRLENLRPVDKKQNSSNRAGISGTRSIYKGVSWHKKANKWIAKIKKNGINKHIGVFNNEQEAALVYNSMASILHGKYAFINEVNPQGKCPLDESLRKAIWYAEKLLEDYE